jgi:hypothetical protein
LALAGGQARPAVKCPNCGASIEVPRNAPVAPGERQPQQEPPAERDPEEAPGASGEAETANQGRPGQERPPQQEHGATSLDLFEPHRNAVERVLDDYFRSPRRSERKGRCNLTLRAIVLVVLSAAVLALCVLVLLR